jgi:hypothetical protein
LKSFENKERFLAQPAQPTRAEQIRVTLGLITEEELAEVLFLNGITTLASWRGQRKGPGTVKLGKKVFYSLPLLNVWINEEHQRQQAERAAELAAQNKAAA